MIVLREKGEWEGCAEISGRIICGDIWLGFSTNWRALEIVYFFLVQMKSISKKKQRERVAMLGRMFFLCRVDRADGAWSPSSLYWLMREGFLRFVVCRVVDDARVPSRRNRSLTRMNRKRETRGEKARNSSRSRGLLNISAVENYFWSLESLGEESRRRSARE